MAPSRAGPFSFGRCVLTQREFVDTIRALATRHVVLNPEGAAAHAAVESRYGQSQLAAEFGNLFGLKRGSSWTGETITLPTWEAVGGKTIQTTAEFRAYPSWVESIADYASVIERLYPHAARYASSPLGFLAGLFTTGPLRWATDPGALSKAAAILHTHDLIAPADAVQRLGRHELVVDNAPTLGKAIEVAMAALAGRPATYRAPHLVTRSRRPDLTYKLDVDLVE